MSEKLITVVIPVFDENPTILSGVVAGMLADPLVAEIIIVDDCSSIPVSLTDAKVVRNRIRMGSAASRAVGISMAQFPIILTTDAHVRFRTKGWGERIAKAVESNPKGVICPSCIPTGLCNLRGKIYGGHLDVIVPRGGGAVVLEPRWNTESTSNGKVGCAMGGAYAFDALWHRKIEGYSGIKGCDPTEMVALSLKARLSGGSIIVLPGVEMYHEFRVSRFKSDPSLTAYNKIRLAAVVMPPEISNIIPTLLTGNPGVTDGLVRFIADFREIAAERNSFWEVCGTSPKEAAKIAGIEFGIDFMTRNVA